jgi:hypothetical protein
VASPESLSPRLLTRLAENSCPFVCTRALFFTCVNLRWVFLLAAVSSSEAKWLAKLILLYRTRTFPGLAGWSAEHRRADSGLIRILGPA